MKYIVELAFFRTKNKKDQELKRTVISNQELIKRKGDFWSRKKEAAYEDGGEGDAGGELGNSEASRSGAGDVVGEGERGKHDFDGELQKVDDLLPVPSGEDLVVHVRLLLHRLQEPLGAPRHSFSRSSSSRPPAALKLRASEWSSGV